MNTKHKFTKKVIAFALCGALMVPVGAMAGEAEGTSKDTVSLADYEAYIHAADQATTRSAEPSLSVQAFDYMEASVDNVELSAMLNDYLDYSGTKEKTYKMFEANLNSTYQEVQANKFTGEQAAQLLKSATDLETGNAEETVFTPVDSDEIPAPPHADADNNTNGSLSVMSNSDISINRNNRGDGSGIGYEVKSTPGYNKTTTFFYPGDCNINRNNKGGIAAYMFYTFGNSKGGEDLGIVFQNGFWQPVVFGTWTGWATGSTHLTVGDKLYFKIWIDANNNINFQGIDGDNFNNILFQGNYPTKGQLPASGAGVTINRQITYAASPENRYSPSGYYLNNARFDQAYLYNNYGYAPFNNSNTDSTHRGKFGATWAPVSRVTIHSNTHWDSETVSIDMQ